MILPPKDYVTDFKMFFLISHLKENGRIKYTQQFCDDIGILKQHIRQIKMGRQHFTLSHIEKACQVYNVNANWLLDLEEDMFRAKK